VPDIVLRHKKPDISDIHVWLQKLDRAWFVKKANDPHQLHFWKHIMLSYCCWYRAFSLLYRPYAYSNFFSQILNRKQWPIFQNELFVLNSAVDKFIDDKLSCRQTQLPTNTEDQAYLLSGLVERQLCCSAVVDLLDTADQAWCLWHTTLLWLCRFARLQHCSIVLAIMSAVELAPATLVPSVSLIKLLSPICSTILSSSTISSTIYRLVSRWLNVDIETTLWWEKQFYQMNET
jgi:hypothetical protein